MEALPLISTKFRHPFTCIVSGASMSGKTVFLSKFIRQREQLIHPPVQRVIYSYKKYQDIFDTMPDVQFVRGDNYKLDKNIPTLLIIDDQAQDIEPKQLVELFTVNCHHDNTSLMFVTQNLFMQNKGYRTAGLNAQSLILFKSPRGPSQINYLARQLTPSKSGRIQEIYQQATKDPYTYLLIDLKPDTPEVLRYRDNILPDEGMEMRAPDGRIEHLTRCYEV